MGCGSSKGADAPTRKTSTSSSGPLDSEMSFYQKYILGSKLGQGAYGQVRAATSVSGEQVAVKVQHVKTDCDARKAWEVLRNESKMWDISSGHEHVVTFFEAFETRNPTTYYIVLEVCQASILDGLKSDSNLITCFSRCFREMLLGIEHVHSRKVVHRDIKPDNFLLGGPDGQTTKLTDFGLATDLPQRGNLFVEAGSAPYMSPELLSQDGYREKTDVWSLGATAYLMLFGRYPYMPLKLANGPMKDAVRKGDPSPKFIPQDPEIQVPDGAVALVKRLLVRNPKKRCSTQEALRFDFVQPRAAPAPVAPVACAESKAVVVLAEAVPAPTELEQPFSSQCSPPSGDGPTGSKVGSAQRNALAAAKALSRTGDFKKRADPTVERDLDELLQRLQAKYEVRAATPSGADGLRASFSKRSFTGSALDAEPGDDEGEKLLGEQKTPLSQVPTPGRRRSSRQLASAGWERRGATWANGDVAEDGLEDEESFGDGEDVPKDLDKRERLGDGEAEANPEKILFV